MLRSKLSTLWSYSELVTAAFAREFPGYVSRVPRGDAALRSGHARRGVAQIVVELDLVGPHCGIEGAPTVDRGTLR